MIKKALTAHPPPVNYECGTIRQHFNHLRNNSSNMRSILSWQAVDQTQSHYQEHIEEASQPSKTEKNEQEVINKQKKNVSFNQNQNNRSSSVKGKTNPQTVEVKKAATINNNNAKGQERAKSASVAKKKGKQDNQDAEIRARIRENQLAQQAEKKEERRDKVKKYIEELKPYTRSLTNTKYQDYFDKAALESYGRANVKNAIGGIIYGNHLKTFNMNPHIRGNEPKHYQTHYTAINYGKRTKLNEQDKWSRLEKQLSKKLGLKDKNQTLKEGKEVVVVDVDDTNMYSVMKQNLSFKKQHDAQIRKLEAEYKQTIQKEKKDAVAEFYASKRDRILSGNTIDSQNSQYVCPRDEKGRLHQQVVYRHTDKNGVVRMGADRHALTCFVDMNFPENDAAYTQELINRMQIFPIQVEDKDKFIDNQRRENYQKSLQNIYPSHYLLPNCDQPEVIKMINQKYGETQTQRKEIVEVKKNMASTFGTTRIDNSSLIAH